MIDQLRLDLAFGRHEVHVERYLERGCGDWQCPGEGAVALIASSDAADVLEQCVCVDFDYAPDTGSSWRWAPLSVGARRESVAPPELLADACGRMAEPPADVHERQYDRGAEEACPLGCADCAQRIADADRIREGDEHV